MDTCIGPHDFKMKQHIYIHLPAWRKWNAAEFGALFGNLAALATAIRKPFERNPPQTIKQNKTTIKQNKNGIRPHVLMSFIYKHPKSPKASFPNIRFVLRIILISNSR